VTADGLLNMTRSVVCWQTLTNDLVTRQPHRQRL